MRSAFLAWCLLPAVLWAGGNEIVIDKDGRCFLDKVEKTPEALAKHFKSHPEDLGSAGDMKLLAITCDGAAPVRAILDVLVHGASAEISAFDVTIDGKTVPVRLPVDMGIELRDEEDEENAEPEIPPTVLSLCSSEDHQGHPGFSEGEGNGSWDKWKEHVAPLKARETATSVRGWIERDPAKGIDLSGKDAAVELARNAVAAVVRAGTRKPGIVIVRCDPDVAAGTWHKVIAALQTAGAGAIQYTPIP
ncbi:MAG: hypothetical protein HUU15_07530 [Candidatus Brocadiae bacterium]|nr:hypothetical protein [Candidatus Brocadiia bacterium]